MLGRAFVIRTIAFLSLALAVGCGEENNGSNNNVTECPAGQVRQGTTCVISDGGTNGNGNNGNSNNNTNTNDNNNNGTAGMGCTDDDASNFDSAATMDDGSCEYAVTFSADLSARDATTIGLGLSVLTRGNGATGFDAAALDEDATNAGQFSGAVDLAPGDYEYRFRIGGDGGENTGIRRFTVVDAPLSIAAGAIDAIEVALPMIVSDNFGPAGFFPDANDQRIIGDTECLDRPGDARGECYEFTYNENGGQEFAGVIWLNGDSFTMNTPRPVEAGAVNLSFYAWGEAGGEEITFGYNLVDGGPGGTSTEVLSTTPTRITIPIAQSYTTVEQAFFWSAGLTAAADPIRFWITDIVWEAGEPESDFPVVVDEAFPGRGGFGTGGPPLHTEDDLCPMRADPPMDREPAGVCHRFVWDSVNADEFTGAIWINGTGFGDAMAVDLPNNAAAIQFYAWAEDDGEVVEFGAGDTDLGDIAQTRQNFTLGTTPALITLPLTALAGYETVIAGFVFAMTQANTTDGATVYIDDIRYVDDIPAGCTDSNAKNFDSSASLDDGSCLYDLTFIVDMGCPDAVDGSDSPIGEVSGFTSVQLTGGFCSFCTDIVATDNSDGTYTVTLTDLALATPSLEYLYITDNFTSKERLFDEAGSCGINLNTNGTTFGNRVITPVSGATYNDVFGQCSSECPMMTTEIMESLNSGTGDGTVFRDGADTSIVGDTAGAITNLGYIGATNNSFVFAFQLPSTLRTDDVISDASIRVRFFNTPENQPDFGADLIGLGTRDDPEIVAADYDTGTAGTSIQVDFMDGATSYTQGDLIMTDATGSTALADFLNTQLQTAGTTPGDWVFFRLEPNGANGTGGNAFWQINTGNEGLADAPPRLTFTADCTTCDPFATGCTASNANNFDSGAITDDGSCLYDVTFNVDMGCPDPDDAFTSVQLTGPFCSFCNNIEMADQGGGIWSITLEQGEGAFEHKFITNGFASQEDLIDDAANGESCAPVTDFSSFANRRVQIDRDNTSFDAIYGHCEGACFETDQTEIVVSSEDARIQETSGVSEALAGAFQVGDTGEATAVVFPVQLPNPLPSGGFTGGQFSLDIVEVLNSPAWNADLYGLPFRTEATGATVLASDFFVGADDTATGVVKLEDDYLTSSNMNQETVKTGEAASAAIASYLNAQVTAGAVAGDWVFFRLNPDSTTLAGGLFVIFSANTPPEAPKLFYK